MSTAFVDQLATYSETDWLDAIQDLLTCIHEVDGNAVQIWFRFYPLSLRRYLDSAENLEETVHGINMTGVFDLKDQIDASHHFLYGHRFWKATKCAIQKEIDEYKGETHLTEIIKEVAIRVAEKCKVERPLVNAIAAIGLATLNQVGQEAFFATSGETEKQPKGLMGKAPDAIVAERKKDDPQGLFGFLRTVDKKFSVKFASLYNKGQFPVILDEEIASASQKDHSKDWQSQDDRCWEGPVPIECTAASCGTCWVGVIEGQEKLTGVERRERRQMKVFGYNQPADDKPFLRLACQARAEGTVTIVIPPWNAVFGKKVYGNVDEVELEPATTSAKNLRETITAATSGE